MAKSYSQEFKNKSLNPKKTTVSFLLNYSKSFTEIKTSKSRFRIHLN